MSRVEQVWTYRGYHCLVMNNSMGYLCGYIMLPISHPLSDTGYDELNAMGFAVHGGLTFAQKMNTIDYEDISVITVAGANEEYFVIGFDCAHAGDVPNPLYSDGRIYTDLLLPNLFGNECVWTVEDVAIEVEQLVEQLCEFDES